MQLYNCETSTGQGSRDPSLRGAAKILRGIHRMPSRREKMDGLPRHYVPRNDDSTISNWVKPFTSITDVFRRNSMGRRWFSGLCDCCRVH
jgi:hypothetical protein